MKKLALVLSGGSAKGYAHIGVIKVLEKYNIKPDLIVGTSMGSLVGGMYASGKTCDELVKIARDFNSLGNFSITNTLFRGHLLDTRKVDKLLKNELGDFKAEDCKIPFVSVATDITRGKEAHLTTGLLRDNIRASITIPGVFKTTEIKGKKYVDGGLCNNLPENVAHKLMPDAVILSVDCIGKYADQVEKLKFDTLENVLNATTILTQNIVRLRRRYADLRIVISQPDVSQMDFKTEKVDLSVSYGESATEKSINQLIGLLKGDANENIKTIKQSSKGN